jgi:hypothetical protein
MSFYIRVPSLIIPVHCITQTEEPRNFTKKHITPPLFCQLLLLIDFIGFYLCFSSPENGFLKETRFLM